MKQTSANEYKRAQENHKGTQILRGQRPMGLATPLRTARFVQQKVPTTVATMCNAVASTGGLKKPCGVSVGDGMTQWPDLGLNGGSPNGGVVTCLLHDIIHAAAALSARMNAVASRSSLTACLRAVMSGSTAIFHILTDMGVQL